MSLPTKIAVSIDNIARKVIGKDWSLYSTLLNHWGEIVGESHALITTPVKISFPKGTPTEEKMAQGNRTDGVLHIKLPQGLAMEFSFLTEQIKQRIADYFGYKAIDRIVFETFYGNSTVSVHEEPISPDPAKLEIMHNKAKDIENEELRSALEELGESVLQSSRNS